MTLQEIYPAVSVVAEEVLQIAKFHESQTMMSTPSWDSLRHIQLLSAIERRFGIEIGGDDAFRLTSADKLVRYIHTRLQEEAQG